MELMHGRPTILTLEDIQEILWSYDQGCSRSNLEKRFHCGGDKINKILFDHGLIKEFTPYLPKNKTYKKLEEIDDFDGKICKGKSYAEYLKENGYKN